MPEIIAHIVIEKNNHRIIRFDDFVKKIREKNPINYNLSLGHKFYEYRLLKFLNKFIFNNTSKSVWSGKYDIVGGIIIIKPNAEMLCYHLIDFNKFKQYLKNSSRLDNPSGSKMGYGTVYKNEKGSFIKLNFQIKA